MQKLRNLHPKLGTRKLLYELKSKLSESEISIGRDSFFSLLRSSGMLIKNKRRYKRTTYSDHGYRFYPNLKQHMDIKLPNTVWVADITYISVIKGRFVYLALLTDSCSRKIVGYYVGESLEAIGAMNALKMAFKQLPKGKEVVHHSDRGIQYCCNAYKSLLATRGAVISMTEQNHCYENSQAERVNGILKHEYGLDEKFKDINQVRTVVKQVVNLYNYSRPHLALDYKYPADVHSELA